MKLKNKPLSVPLESEEQRAVVDYLEFRGLKFSSIPNSTFTRSWKQKTKNKQEGLRAGLPDLLVVTKDHLLFIEMKRLKGGKVSSVQKEWLEALNKINDGVVAKICKGAEEAIEFINKYI